VKIFKGFEIRRSLELPFVLGWGALALGLILGMTVRAGTGPILAGLGGLTVLTAGAAELTLRRRERV
jgi:hypothetical protein